LDDSARHDDPFVQQVGAYIEAHQLIPPRAGVVVGVSGGVDSVALLCVLVHLAKSRERKWDLTVGHLDHALRSSSADDAAFVSELAEKWSVPCVVERRKIAREVSKMPGGIEETGRGIRYEFLTETAAKCGASIVAVAHHADDNVETILYRIARGTHLRGLSGIPVSRALGESNISLVRPLLGSRRADIESFARRCHLDWRTDRTNVEVRYRRNFIRCELLPLMREKLNVRVDEALERVSAAAGEAEEYLLARAQEVLERGELRRDSDEVVVDLNRLVDQPPIIRRYVMRIILENLGASFRKVTREGFERLDRLVEPGGASSVTVSGDLVARRKGERIVVSRCRGEQRTDVREVDLDCPGVTDLGDDFQIACRIEPFDAKVFEAHCERHGGREEMLDADQIIGELISRPRRPGDAFHPLGCGGRQSVSDFLTNLKLPRHKRAAVRCICDSEGIIYVAPLRIDERVKLTDTTRRVLRVRLRGFGDP